MKTIKSFYIISALLLFTNNISAQENVFDQTWYLRSLTIEDETTYAPYQENLNLLFEEDNGENSAFANGVENGFSGLLTLDEMNNSFQFDEISVTLLGCEVAFCDIEALYFYSFLTDEVGALKEFEYSFSQEFFDFQQLTLQDEHGNTAIFFNTPLFAPPPELFQTWYLYQTEGDLKPPYPVTSNDPPQITINEDLSFIGSNEVLDFQGSIVLVENLDSAFTFIIKDLIDLTFNESDVETGIPEFRDDVLFEANVFGDTNSGSGFFDIEFAPGFISSFRNILLSVDDNAIDDIAIHPNPTSEILYISNISSPLTSVQIISISGAVIDQTTDVIDEISLAHLTAGIYFIKLTSQERSIIKKIIKQ